MVVWLKRNLKEALQEINFNDYQEIEVYNQEEERTNWNSDEIISRYGESKWKIVDLLNKKYSHLLSQPFNLHNWLNFNLNDEVAYFLSEAGSNCLAYSQYKSPSKFHLWHGEKGFIIGIEQLGEGFPAEEINNKKIKENEGAAFIFFRNCRNKIFFNNPESATVVFMEYLFE